MLTKHFKIFTTPKQITRCCHKLILFLKTRTIKRLHARKCKVQKLQFFISNYIKTTALKNLKTIKTLLFK